MTFGGVQHGPGPAPWAEAVAATLAALVPAQAQPQKMLTREKIWLELSRIVLVEFVESFWCFI